MKKAFLFVVVMIIVNFFLVSNSLAAIQNVACNCSDGSCRPTQIETDIPSSTQISSDSCKQACGGVISMIPCDTQKIVDKAGKGGGSIDMLKLKQTSQTSLNPVGFAAGQTGFFQIIRKVINFLVGTAGMVSMIFYIWAGILWMSAAGNSENVGKAQTILTWNTLGLVILLSSYVIVQFVFKNILGQ